MRPFIQSFSHSFMHCPTHVTPNKSEMNLNDARSVAAAAIAMALSRIDNAALPHTRTYAPAIVGIQLIEFLFFRTFAIFSIEYQRKMENDDGDDT